MQKLKIAAKAVVGTRRLQKGTILSHLLEADSGPSPVSPPKDNRNYSWVRRCFQGDESSYYHASLALAIVAGIEGACFTLLFRHYTDSHLVEKTPFMLISVLAAFLVVFRTQICYNRWWEGRSAVGTLNKSRCSLED